MSQLLAHSGRKKRFDRLVEEIPVSNAKELRRSRICKSDVTIRIHPDDWIGQYGQQVIRAGLLLLGRREKLLEPGSAPIKISPQKMDNAIEARAPRLSLVSRCFSSDS